MVRAVAAGGILCYVTGFVGYVSFRGATEGDILDNFMGPLASCFKVLVIAHLVMYIPHEVRPPFRPLEACALDLRVEEWFADRGPRLADSQIFHGLSSSRLSTHATLTASPPCPFLSSKRLRDLTQSERFSPRIGHLWPFRKRSTPPWFWVQYLTSDLRLAVFTPVSGTLKNCEE